MAKVVSGGQAEIEKIEAQIETVKHLASIWYKFYQIMLMSFDPTATLSQHEPEFQKVKQILAERHELLVNSVTHDHHVAQNILNMMRRAITLETFQRLSELEMRKTLIDWHDANILLYETLGDLTYRRDQIERQRELGLSRVDQAVRKRPIRQMLRSNWFRNLVTWGIILGLVAVVVLNWEAIEDSAFYKERLGFLHQPVEFIKGLFGGGGGDSGGGE